MSESRIKNLERKVDELSQLLTQLVSDTAYAASWDSVDKIAPSKNAVYDKIEEVSGDLKSNPISPIFKQPSNESTAGANNVYREGGFSITHGTNSYDSSTYCQYDFPLPSHYVNGANFKFHIIVCPSGAGAKTIKYKVEFSLLKDTLAIGVEQTVTSTWDETANVANFEEVTCTTSINYVAGGGVMIRLYASDNAEAVVLYTFGAWLELL